MECCWWIYYDDHLLLLLLALLVQSCPSIVHSGWRLDVWFSWIGASGLTICMVHERITIDQFLLSVSQYPSTE